MKNVYKLFKKMRNDETYLYAETNIPSHRCAMIIQHFLHRPQS